MLFEQEVGPQPPRDVRSQIEITSLLKTLQQSRDPLMVTFSERAQKFQSFIVNIDSASGMLWIDELIPREGDRYVEQGESFRIDAWHEGVHMRWSCAGAQKVVFENAPAYSAPLPADMIYHQKRGAFRAAVHRSLETKVGLIKQQRQHQILGELADISATGCKARFVGDLRNQVTPGELHEQSFVELPDAGRIGLTVEVRHIVYDEAAGESHVGLRFHQPPPSAQRQIDRYVNTLQREARRLEKEDLF
ncbi:c-di-GMP-binding flagellar brake protein YcgR, contains PilZNR and PilZ domains [Halopseudomonas xinjiangensis]|uniref:C-di-GMP-binding flagellar brake protein YcgR, contains PilZNR and PilZ domains n=1 Tax=Halopseudomonas xinjiangensis TaxID=487184 RepID=A0A1H1U6D0_9GAMM|nr:flagellar brake protein [Halopseudomonas xinjiangensis]SDS67806.1 c-di-GMP-binding flagellar brake protein YcgR, contains PilZNR and PilZ domains [Halopseudomonas xinjiangensis]